MEKFMILKKQQEYILISSKEQTEAKISMIRIPLEEFQQYIGHYPAVSVSLDNPIDSLEVHSKISASDDSIFLKQEGYYRKYLYSDILWVEAARSYCYINLKNDKKVILTESSSKIEELLPKKVFIRIHRTFIINKCYVDSYIGNMLYIGKNKFPISKQYKDDVLACFNFCYLKNKHRKK